MEIGTQLELTITGISHQGYGIGRVDNIVVFIPGAMLGETVLAEVTDYKKKMITAQKMDLRLVIYLILSKLVGNIS